MLFSCSRVVSRRILILPKQFSSVLKKSHFSTSRFASVPLLSQHFRSGISQSLPCSCRISKGSVFLSSRLDHTMASQSNEPKSVYDFTVKKSTLCIIKGGKDVKEFVYTWMKDAKGQDVDLSIYKGKVLLIVNVASQCGLTNSNYTELTKVYDKYKDQGLEILAFPCNQFGSQEPGNNEEIQQFACTRFKAEFPIFDKVDVNGANAAPIYKFLKASKGGIFGDGIKWNFSKFLVDKEGQVVDRYAPTTSPLSIEKDIKKLLGVA